MERPWCCSLHESTLQQRIAPETQGLAGDLEGPDVSDGPVVISQIKVGVVVALTGVLGWMLTSPCFERCQNGWMASTGNQGCCVVWYGV